MQRLIFTVAMVLVAAFGARAQAQQSWVQLEAHPNLAEAQEAARGYAEILRDVTGMRLGSGWYAVAIGPLDEETASVRLRGLRSDGAIPRDAFIVRSVVYTEQFYPIGSTALADAQARLEIAGEEEDSDTVTTIELAQIAPQADNADAPATPEATVVAPEVVEATPEPTPEPEETVQQARRSERDLNRAEREELQVALQWFGFYDGRIDAAFGRGTRGGMADYQNSIGAEPTGVLTTRQRARLLQDYATVFAELGLESMRDDRAGIEMTLPTGLVSFDRYDPPFAHYTSANDSGVRVLLISQTGTEATLLGLYDIMQTLEIVPLDGERERSRNSFTLTGENDRITSYTYAELDNGHVKGFTLIWPKSYSEERIRQVVLGEMRDSFSVLSDTVLPDAIGDGEMEQSVDLLSGLRIRRPERTRSGFFVNNRGAVLTTMEAVEGCGRVTIEEAYEAQIASTDTDLGLAVLTPDTPLAPIDFARFQAGAPRLQSEVAVAGYSYDGVLSAPTLTFGTLEDVRGLQGQETLKRLALNARPGDAGGPVFDTTGSVLGMLLPDQRNQGRVLPEDVSFATDATAIGAFLNGAGIRPSASSTSATLAPEDLTRIAGDMTVLVSCWD